MAAILPLGMFINMTMVVVEGNSGKETSFDVQEKTALDYQIGVPQAGEGTTKSELKSLYAVLNPAKKGYKRFTGGRGGGE